MKGKLFGFAILRHPKPTKDDCSPQSALILEPKTVIATDEKHVQVIAAKFIPDDLLDKLDEVEILVRPF